MQPARSSRYDAVVRNETLISTAVYALIPAAVLWLAGAAAPANVFGPHGVVQALALPAGVGTFMMTVALTMIIRRRVHRGSLPRFDRPAARGLGQMVPNSLPVRAVVLALVALALFVPGGCGVVLLMHLVPLSTNGFVVFNVLYGACLGLVMTPHVVRAALAD